MKTVSLLNQYHNFSKSNLTTISKGGRLYDIYKCSKCGMEGKRFGVTKNLTILDKYSNTQIQYCTEDPKQIKDTFIGEWIKITYCTAQGKPFENLTPDSNHRIVTPPDENINGDRGVWVMGVGEPVKVLFDEYNDINFKRTKFKK